ncbi:MAG: hypothetical protein EOM36_02845 [Bacteroidia bacterium]|nr:hypothetical protein [Bacteroidia bacterium]
MAFLDLVQDAKIGQAAKEAAIMQKVAESAKQQGASEYAQGLARLAAEQKYMDVTASQPVPVVTTYPKLNNPYSGAINFVPAGLASYERELASRNSQANSLVDNNNAPVKIVGDPRVAPTGWEGRSGFGKTVEILTSPHSNENGEYFAF